MKINTTRKHGVITELRPDERAGLGLDTRLSPAFQVRHILVPTDFSDCAGKALEIAIPLARQLNAELVLLHVVEPCPASPELVLLEVETTRSAKEELELIRTTKAATLQSRSVVREGYADKEIVKVIDELGIDLVVIATRGRTGLAHILLGSISEKVVRYSPCPVLVVPERNTPRQSC